MSGHLKVKKILLKGKERGEEMGVKFWGKFKGSKEEILSTSRGAFVLSFLCDSAPSVGAELKKDKGLKKTVKAKIKEGGNVKGYQALMERI